MNKYFKSKGSFKKIYFKQEQVQKVIYYLKNEEKKRKKKGELAITSDSQKIEYL